MKPSKIADQLLSLFLSEKVDRIELIYTKFVSLVSSRPVVQTLLPLDPQGLEAADDEIFRLTTRGGQLKLNGTQLRLKPVLSLGI